MPLPIPVRFEMPKVSEIMVKAVTTIPTGSGVAEAAVVMIGRGVGRLVVTEGGRPVGIVTERDLVKVIAEGRDPASTKISEVMSSPLITIEPSSPMKEAAKLMVDKRIRALVVVEDEALVGIVTIRDITRSVVNTIASIEEALKLEKGPVIEFED